MIRTPLATGNFTATFNTTLSAVPTAAPAIGATATVKNLQCATLTDQVVFSLTFELAISYQSGGTVTDTFTVPYANGLSVPGTVAGMACDIAATITGGTVNINVGSTLASWSISFSITANTFFPPPQAIDVDSNIAQVGQ